MFLNNRTVKYLDENFHWSDIDVLEIKKGMLIQVFDDFYIPVLENKKAIFEVVSELKNEDEILSIDILAKD